MFQCLRLHTFSAVGVASIPTYPDTLDYEIKVNIKTAVSKLDYLLTSRQIES